MNGTCECGGSTRMILACSGAADVGEIADRTGRKLSQQGVGKMFCLAGIGAQAADMIDRIRNAKSLLVIDGCEKDCGKNALAHAGISATQIRITSLGLEKGKSPATAETVDKIAALVASQIG